MTLNGHFTLNSVFAQVRGFRKQLRKKVINEDPYCRQQNAQHEL